MRRKTLRERAEDWSIREMIKNGLEHLAETQGADENEVVAWLAGYRAAKRDKRRGKL